jgi:hypothetical protein
MEKRNSNRHQTDQSIVCMFFTSHSINDTFDGKMKNYCDTGLYAELQTHFKVGTVLLVRTKRISLERSRTKIVDGFRSMSLAQVKWSKPICVDGTTRFATGLKHLIA